MRTPDALDALVVVGALAAAWAMTGLIWTVQVVHYPLFDAVGRRSDDQAWASFSERHRLRMSLVVAPIMAVQWGTAIVLVVEPPPGVPRVWPAAAIAVLLVPYLATAFISVPLHQQLSSLYDEDRHRRLVVTNWIRTITWSAHAVLVAAIAVWTIDRT